MTDFLSDNVSPAHPAVLRALGESNGGPALPYGDDQWSARLNEAFSELFETRAAVIPVLTGTAANSLALAALAGPTDAVCVHAESHVARDECNAPEFFTGGARMIALEGENGKISAETLDAVLDFEVDVHCPRPRAVSVTQATELGTLYGTDELEALGKVAQRRGIGLHMDGARFANAVAALNCSPAELTWKRGVDILSFGGTKNGCVMAEAVVLFRDGLEPELRRRVKRAGQLLSKGRYVAAQLLAHIEGGLWLENAAHANRMCRLLHERLHAMGVAPVRPPEANMMFVLPGRIGREQFAAAGYSSSAQTPLRLCTSWCTTEEDVGKLTSRFAKGEN